MIILNCNIEFQKGTKPCKNHGDKLCESVMNYIDTHVLEIDVLSELGDVFGYNYCYLSSVFKKKTGITLASYYQKCRFVKAKKMLDENPKVATVAEILKYSSMYSFSKAFKNYWQVSPRNYVKNRFQSK